MRNIGLSASDAARLHDRISTLESTVRTIEDVLSVGVQALIREAVRDYDARLPDRLLEIIGHPQFEQAQIVSIHPEQSEDEGAHVRGVDRLIRQSLGALYP